MSPGLPDVTAERMLRALQRAGWRVARQKGSHVQLKHPDRPGLVTVPRHAGMTLSPFLVRSIVAQAGLSEDELRGLL